MNFDKWAEQSAYKLRAEHERLKEHAESWARLAANWQHSAYELRTERDQLKEINDRMAADRERLITERDEWKEWYINAGVEAELKIQRGWPDFRDTVAELDIARQQIDELTQARNKSDANHEKWVSFTADKLRSLEADSAKLGALEAAGVDNWSGYDCAMEILEENSDD